MAISCIGICNHRARVIRFLYGSKYNVSELCIIYLVALALLSS